MSSSTDEFETQLKKITKRSLDWHTRAPSVEDDEGYIDKDPDFKGNLFYYGNRADGLGFYANELDHDAHCDILGTTRQGKSSLLELRIRHNIDNGVGATLL